MTEGVSADIQTTNVHAGDGTNALEVSSVEYWWRMEYKTYKHNISICWR